METDMLSSILNNPEALQNAMKMASELFGGGGDSGSGGGEGAPASASEPQPSQSARKTDYDPSAELMQRAMPVISNIMQSGQSAVRGEKRALLNAVKPFVTDEVAVQFDHAMRLVSLARMARSAFGQFGKTGNTADDTRTL